MGASERVAFAVVDVLLRVNGRGFEVDEADTWRSGLIERHRLELATIGASLRAHVR